MEGIMITIRRLLQCFLLLACCCCLNAQNLLTNNPGFETDSVAPSDKPDYWLPRYVSNPDYHHVETNSANVYSGSKCALFNNTSASDADCYYYYASDAAGTTTRLMDAESDAVYEFSVKYKTDSAFTGYGIYLEVFYYDKDNNAIGMDMSGGYTSSTWNTLKLTSTARGSVSKVAVGIIYQGKGKLWVDDAQLIKAVSPLCKNGNFAVDAAPLDIPDYWYPRYTQYQHVETSYLNTYLGDNAGLFNYTSTNGGYFYGPYNAAGSQAQYIPVCPGDSYTISCLGRVDPAFSGNGIFLSLLFLNGTNYVSRENSSYVTPAVWTNMTLDAVVPAGANNMLYSAEYNGQNKAWVDEVKVVRKNLVVNSSFETDAATPTDKPDYWYPRFTNDHHIETTPANVYEGSKCALFNNDSGSSVQGYYYGPSDVSGNAVQYMDVVPGEYYVLSAWGKVASDFTGAGIRISLCFLNNGTFITRSDSEWTTPTAWTQKWVSSGVPCNANQMSYSVEYSGQKKAWIDKVELSKTSSPWYYTKAPDSSLESLSFTPPAKASFNEVSGRFTDYHSYFELHYMENGPAGTWGVGFGAPDNHPLVRTSANAVLGYLRAYNKIQNSVYLQRAQAGLAWLLTQQATDGSFPVYWSNTPTYDLDALMYEGGLAGIALIEGYKVFGTASYLTASNNLCTKLVNSPANINANMNGFAITALAANYEITGTQSYLNKALSLMDLTCGFQLDSGMWSDDHNQYVWYHGIITRSLVKLLDVMPDSNPKKEVVRKCLYKALNHLRRNQGHSANPVLGLLRIHPLRDEGDYNCMYSTMAVCEAYSLLGMTSLSDSMDTLSVGAGGMTGHEVTQGHAFAALGIMLDSYY